MIGLIDALLLSHHKGEHNMNKHRAYICTLIISLLFAGACASEQEYQQFNKLYQECPDKQSASCQFQLDIASRVSLLELRIEELENRLDSCKCCNKDD